MAYWEPPYLKDMVAYIQDPNVSMYIRRDHADQGEGGVDLTSPGGTDVLALADGPIIGLGYFCHGGGPYDNPTSYCANGQPGYGVVTTHSNIPGYGMNDIYYQHINLDPSLKMGGQVIRGQKLGTIVPDMGEVEIGLNAGTPTNPWGAIWGGNNHPNAWADDPRPQIKALMNMGQPTGVPSSGGSMVDITLLEFVKSAVTQLRNNAGVTNVLGQGPSQNILNFMVSWAHQEGGSQTNACKFNVLNTMQTEPGSTQCANTLPGIQSYTDSISGEKALVDALQNGRYASLLHAITTNDENGLGFSNPHAMAQNIAGDLSMWVHGSRTPIAQDYILKIMSGAGITGAWIQGGLVNTGLGTPQATIDQWGKTVIGQGVDQSASSSSNPLDALKSIGDFFTTMGNFFSNPARIAKMFLGIVLIIAGIVLVIKELTPAPVKKAAKVLSLA